MKLTDDDYMKLASMIDKGSNSIEYEKDGELLSFDCEYETEGYVEDDQRCGYEKGTGAWVETSRALSITDSASFDSDGNETSTDIDERRLEKAIA